MMKMTTKSGNCRSHHHPVTAYGKRNAPTLISTEARRRLRLLSAELRAHASRIELAAQRVPEDLTRDARRKFSKGAAQAVDRIVRTIPAQLLLRDGRSAAWRYLRPTPEHRAIDVMVMLLNAYGKPGLRKQQFGLSVTYHALGRVLDRSVMMGDPVRAIFEAHDALLVLEPTDGDKLFELQSFLLPADRGSFVVVPDRADNDLPMAVARTWLDADQLFPDQEAHVAAWGRLLHAQHLSPIAAVQ